MLYWMLQRQDPVKYGPQLMNELKIEDCGCFALQLPIEEWQYPGCWWNLESETDISWIPPARRPGHPPYCFEWTSKVQEKTGAAS